MHKIKIIYRWLKFKLQAIAPGIYNVLNKHKEGVKYIIAGGVAAVINLSFLYIFTDILHIWYVLSAVLAFIIALCASFSLHKFWTFRENSIERLKGQAIFYIFLSFINLTLNAILIYIMVDIFKLWYMLAQFIIMIAIAVMSFIINKKITFQKQMSNSKKNILIATGIYPPDIGGPATYLSRLHKELAQFGYKIVILTYADTNAATEHKHSVSRHHNALVRYWYYFLYLWKIAKHNDIIFAQDLVSTGLPAGLVKLLRPNLKLVVRIGGDFLWEKSYNKGWTTQTLDKYYKQHKNIIEKFYLMIYKFVLRQCDSVIFSTHWQKNIYEKYIKSGKTKYGVVENAFPSIDEIRPIEYIHDILFVGRLIKLKNIERIAQVAASLQLKFTIIGDGPLKEKISNMDNVIFLDKMSEQDVLQEMAKSRVVVVPAASEVSPNTVLECIKLKKPVLVTKYCGYYDKYKDQLLFIDPFNAEDIKYKLQFLLNDASYVDYIKKIHEINDDRNFINVANEFNKLFINM